MGEASSTVDGNSVVLTVPLKNTGKRDGTEIVQVYIRNTADKEGPLKTLRAFKRVDVKAGQKVTETIRLSRESFEGWDSETNTMRFVPGTYEIFVGNSSADKDLQCLTVQIQ
jgi:beta-glucosidase